MGNDPEREKLDDLAARIQKASGQTPVTDEAKPGEVKMGRVGFDFLSSILGSAFLGWLIDKYVGTKPWGMIGLIILGFGVGVMGVWRSLSDKPTAPRG